MRRKSLELQFLFLRDIKTLKEELNLFPSDESLWKDYKGISNSAGNLILHLCGNLEHFIGTVLGNTGYIREREKEFSDKNISISELNQLIDAAYTSVEKTFDHLEDETFDDLYPETFRNESISCYQMLTHIYAHLSYHLGQVNYYRRLHT
jgi:uncharacterized damage-inducible protein DinB